MVLSQTKLIPLWRRWQRAQASVEKKTILEFVLIFITTISNSAHWVTSISDWICLVVVLRKMKTKNLMGVEILSPIAAVFTTFCVKQRFSPGFFIFLTSTWRRFKLICKTWWFTVSIFLCYFLPLTEILFMNLWIM